MCDSGVVRDDFTYSVYAEFLFAWHICAIVVRLGRSKRCRDRTTLRIAKHSAETSTVDVQMQCLRATFMQRQDSDGGLLHCVQYVYRLNASCFGISPL